MEDPLERELRRIGELVPMPLRPMIGVASEDAKRIRQVLRKIPTWRLKEALEAAQKGAETGLAIMDKTRVTVISALEEMLSERGELWRRK